MSALKIPSNIRGRPEGSTSLEIFIASEVAISWFAGEMANIIQLGCTIRKLDCL